MKRKLRPQDYTVGWICALSIELAVAAVLLDEEHECLPSNSNDQNSYTLGCMSGHNIVIACLPAGCMGTNSAATVASHMQSTFKSIRFGLMIGIGGGVPSSDSDIRLGDIVVSQPSSDHGGIIQYDFGKTESNGFRRTGFLNAPPALLLSAVSTLRANHYRNQSSLLPNIERISQEPRFSRTSAGKDILFEATYNHVGGTTCDRCDETKVVQRSERASAEITIHYGTIASGNQVMKDGRTRDRLGSEQGGILCFEMEAAGLMNCFPCLVIRGICDYADSHKNKSWQPYAAAVAAAYGKALLSIIPTTEVAEQHTVLNAMGYGADPVKLPRTELEAALSGTARRQNVKLNWRESVVDLLKLLGLDSGPKARDRLAEKLHIDAGVSGSSKQNIALREAIMNELIVGECRWMEVMKSREDDDRCPNCGSSAHRELECRDNCGKCLYSGHKASKCEFLVRCVKCRRQGHIEGECSIFSI